MIMIDVFIPSLYRPYDFEVNEKETAANLVVDIKEIVERQHRIKFKEAPYALFDYGKGEFIKNDMSLAEQGIGNGDRLILI